jgi:hypothetical protein
MARRVKERWPPAMGGSDASGIESWTLPFWRLTFSTSETE